MVFNFLTKIGMYMKASDLFACLITLFPNDPYATAKSAGCIGGSCRHGRIVPIIIRGTLYYKRVV